MNEIISIEHISTSLLSNQTVIVSHRITRRDKHNRVYTRLTHRIYNINEWDAFDMECEIAEKTEYKEESNE